MSDEPVDIQLIEECITMTEIEIMKLTLLYQRKNYVPAKTVFDSLMEKVESINDETKINGVYENLVDVLKVYVDKYCPPDEEIEIQQPEKPEPKPEDLLTDEKKVPDVASGVTSSACASEKQGSKKVLTEEKLQAKTENLKKLFAAQHREIEELMVLDRQLKNLCCGDGGN